ncbi:hypothetical protein ACLB1Q_22935 [Escherichia coli]
MEQNLELLATAETWDNGKPIRETSAADPLRRLTISAISPRVFGRRKVGSVKLIAKPWPIISMNR